MRVKYILGVIVALLHGLCYLIVLVGGTADIGCDGIMIALVEIIDAGEIAWVAYVHCVGNGCLAWLRFVLTCLQVVVENIVGIVGCDEAVDRQAHLVTEQTGCDITEVSAWYTDYQLVCQSFLLHTCIGIEIVECLRQEASYIDRVG